MRARIWASLLPSSKFDFMVIRLDVSGDVSCAVAMSDRERILSYGCACDESTRSQNTTKVLHPNSRSPVQSECFSINKGGGATPDFARDGFWPLSVALASGALL
jgi:hypothetical protein